MGREKEIKTVRERREEQKQNEKEGEEKVG